MTQTPLPIDAKVLPFRRPAAAVRVRRKSGWAVFGRPFVQAIALVGTPTAIAFWLFVSPAFALARVEVDGNRRVGSAELERALGSLRGANLLRLDLAAVEALLVANPWIGAVTIDKRLPDGLSVWVVEREPRALLRSGGELLYLDGDGRIIAPLDPLGGVQDLLIVSLASRDASALARVYALADELARVAPEWGAALSEIEVLGEGDFRIYVATLPFALAVREGTLAERLPQLARLLPEIARRYAAVDLVDLRFPRRIVFQPRERSAAWPSQTAT